MANVSSYQTIFAPGYSVTGIRRDGAGSDAPVLISGTYTVNQKPQGLLYRGPFYPTDPSGYIKITPTFNQQVVTTSIFYGPNTPLFNPEIGEGNIRAVGSYKYSGSKGDHGMMYDGPPDGSGTWTQINVPESVAGAAVANTIPHSTMGDIVVGNYDLQGQPGSGNAFVFNMKTGGYQALKIGHLATAYGIWQNGGPGSSSYTIAGGYSAKPELNAGFLLDYNAKTGVIGAPTPFSYSTNPGSITHFEGISDIGNGYSLAATTDAGATFAVVSRKPDGSYGAPTWVVVPSPSGTGKNTANSVLGTDLIGIDIGKDSGLQSYAAIISP